jgi:hypothetical protein
MQQDIQILYTKHDMLSEIIEKQKDNIVWFYLYEVLRQVHRENILGFK